MECMSPLDITRLIRERKTTGESTQCCVFLLLLHRCLYVSLALPSKLCFGMSGLTCFVVRFVAREVLSWNPWEHCLGVRPCARPPHLLAPVRTLRVTFCWGHIFPKQKPAKKVLPAFYIIKHKSLRQVIGFHRSGPIVPTLGLPSPTSILFCKKVTHKTDSIVRKKYIPIPAQLCMCLQID